VFIQTSYYLGIGTAAEPRLCSSSMRNPPIAHQLSAMKPKKENPIESRLDTFLSRSSEFSEYVA